MNVNKALEDYLFYKNIYIRNEYFNSNELKSEDEILAHVKLIVEFQKILYSFNSSKVGGINSSIGRDLEKIKISYIVLKNLEDDEIYNIIKNRLNNLLIDLKKIDIKSLIKRSSVRKEISIGRLDEKNIRILDEIEIGKIKKINYNLIEEDFIKYIVRIRKNDAHLNLEKIIGEYTLKSKLGEESFNYINVMALAPWESIRYINKFKSKINKEVLKNLMINDKVI